MLIISDTLKEVCLQSNVISLCLSQLEEPNPLLKQWLALCLGKLWRKYDPARWCGVRDSAHEKLQSLLWHDIPDVSRLAYLACKLHYFVLFLLQVRAAAVFAMGTYILNTAEDGNRTDQATSIDHAIAVQLLPLLTDGSPIVRQVWVVVVVVVVTLLFVFRNW